MNLETRIKLQAGIKKCYVCHLVLEQDSKPETADIGGICLRCVSYTPERDLIHRIRNIQI